MNSKSHWLHPWATTVAVILPGVIVLLQQTIGRGQPFFNISSAVIAVLALVLLGVGFAVKRRVAAWFVPALGALLWEGLLWSNWIYIELDIWWHQNGLKLYDFLYTRFGLRSYIVATLTCLFGLVVVSILLFALYLAWRKLDVRIPITGWGIIGITAIAVVIHSSGAMTIGFSADMLFFDGPTKLFAFLLPVPIAVLLARKDDVVARLLMLVCVPVWAELLFGPAHALRQYISQTPNALLVAVALFAWRIVPPTYFLILAPIATLRSRSGGIRNLWLLTLPLLVLIGLFVLRGIALQAADQRYTTGWWFEWLITAVELWLPLWLTATISTHQQIRVAIPNPTGQSTA